MAAGPGGRHIPWSVPGRTLPRAWPEPEPEPAAKVQRNSQGPSPRRREDKQWAAAALSSGSSKSQLLRRGTRLGFRVRGAGQGHSVGVEGMRGVNLTPAALGGGR